MRKDGDKLPTDRIGVPFIFDGIPSELYNLSLAFIDQDQNNVPSGSGIELLTDQITREPSVVLLGEKQTPALEFPIVIFSDEGMDVYKQIEMKNWLFGTSGFKRFQICNNDYKTYYFNCKLIPDVDMYYQSMKGFKCIVQCDNIGAYEFPKTLTFRNPNVQYFDFLFNNMSGNVGYMFPILEFKTTTSNTRFAILNKSDNNRLFEFTGLQGSEIITIDNQKKIITSSTGLSRLNNFNKKFLRLKKGVNELQAIGTCEYFSITSQSMKRLGGVVYD